MEVVGTGLGIVLDKWEYYDIDWDNIKTVDDIKEIFKAMGIGLNFNTENQKSASQMISMLEKGLIKEKI